MAHSLMVQRSHLKNLLFIRKGLEMATLVLAWQDKKVERFSACVRNHGIEREVYDFQHILYFPKYYFEATVSFVLSLMYIELYLSPLYAKMIHQCEEMRHD